MRSAWRIWLLLQCRYTDSWCSKNETRLAHRHSNVLQQKDLVASILCRSKHSLAESAGEQSGGRDADISQHRSQTHPGLALRSCSMPQRN